jgi:hypothetical protein
MDFGFTGCHSSVPSLQRLAVYTAEALEELEAAFLPRARPARKTRRPRVAVERASAEPVTAKRIAKVAAAEATVGQAQRTPKRLRSEAR